MVGYRSLTPQEQLENNDHRRRSYKAMKRDFAEKVYIKDENMTDEQRKLQAALTHQDTVDIRQIAAHQSEHKVLLASPESVARYLVSNQIRPRAVLIEEDQVEEDS